MSTKALLNLRFNLFLLRSLGNGGGRRFIRLYEGLYIRGWSLKRALRTYSVILYHLTLSYFFPDKAKPKEIVNSSKREALRAIVFLLCIWKSTL